MHFSAFEKARISGFYFFTFPYLFDALFLSRMPALKAQTGAPETEIGWVLLTLGLCGLCALLSGNQLLRRVGSRRLCPWSMLAMCVVLVLGTRATTVPGLAVCAGLFGFFLNVSDLCANTHAVLVEVRYKKPTMSMLHAFYGIGLLIGSSAGGLAAALNLSPSESLGFMTIPAVLLLYPAWKHVEKDPPLEKPVPGKKKRERVPRLVWFCGLTVLGSYSVTGAAGDWGSLFMYTCKGANEETAALAYGLCGTSLAFFRLLGDWLRTQLGDRLLATGGAIVAFLSMGLVIIAPDPVTALIGYTLLGIGLFPLGPVFYSKAGQCPGVSTAKATSVVVLMANGPLMLFPPLIGSLAGVVGLQKAMLVPLCITFLLIPWTMYLMRHDGK